MWAFGCTFYEVFHVSAMFSGPFLVLQTKIMKNQLRKFEADCPEEYKNAIMQCFEADPKKRPDALQFLEVVENIRQDTLQQLSVYKK